MWKTAMRLKELRTPSERATTTGTPNLGRPVRKGEYAREIQDEAKALCHVSDLMRQSQQLKSHNGRLCGRFTKILLDYLPSITGRTELDHLISQQRWHTCPNNIYRQKNLER